MKKKLVSVSDEVIRAALLLRLLSLLLIVFTPSRITVAATVGQILVGIAALVLLRSSRARRLAARHPLVIMLDTAMLAIVAVLSGVEGPFILTFMTSSLLVGLWVSLWAGGAIIVAQGLLYTLIAFPSAQEAGVTPVLLPFVFVIMWWLGYAVQDAGQQERQARHWIQAALAASAANEERNRLAREIHDTLVKSLQAINLTATALPTLLERRPSDARGCAAELTELSVTAISDARALMSELRRRPDERRLPELLTQLCTRLRERSNLSIQVDLDGQADADQDLVRQQLLMAAGEALENVHRHARASEVTVTLAEHDGQLELTVTDDGVGVPPGRQSQAEDEGHFGLRGMAERMALIGGRLELTSVPGKGTRVVLRAPRQSLIEVGEI